MKIKEFIIAGIIILTIFFVNYSEAVEVQLPAGQDTAEAVKKIELFLKNNPFPDSAYNAEIDKNVTVTDNILNLKIKVRPMPEFFDSFRKTFEQALGYEEINGPWIGIIKMASSRWRDTDGVSIVGIEKNGPAARAGLEKGDLIYAIKNKKLRDPQALEELVEGAKVGEVIELKVIRDKPPYVEQYLAFSITVSEKRMLKIKNTISSKNEGVLKLFGYEYKMSYTTLDSIMKLFNKDAEYNHNKLEFPFVIRYKLKNSSGQIIQSYENELKGSYYGPKDVKWGVDFDKLYISDNISGITVSLEQTNSLEKIKPAYLEKEFKDNIKVTVAPEHVKEIVASIVTKQKEQEKEQERLEAQRKEEAEQKKSDAEMKKKEEIRRKQAEKIKQQRTAKLNQLLPKCDGKILSHEDFLLGKNPYADKGKCVEFTAATFQMTSANTGLFNIGNNELAFIEFKETFRGSGVQGIAKIKGLYNYTTRGGISNQVPHLEMLEIEKILGR